MVIRYSIGAVSGNEIIKINLLLHAFPVVTAKESVTFMSEVKSEYWNL